jgi:hypothetical protein
MNTDMKSGHYLKKKYSSVSPHQHVKPHVLHQYVNEDINASHADNQKKITSWHTAISWPRDRLL